MSGTFSRRAFLRSASAVATGAGAMLAGCSSSTIESALVPARFIGFGDAFADLGQTGKRYTVNDGSVNNWTQSLSASYGLSLNAVRDGGLSYAQGNARVARTPDAAGNAATPTVTQQITTFLAGKSFGATDVVVMAAGQADIIAEMALLLAGGQSSDQLLANVGAAGAAMGQQIQRLVKAGAKYVVVSGVYNLGRSPWASSVGQTALIEAASSRFNEQLLINIVDLGANVLYVDAMYYFNLMTASPNAYGLTDATTVVCNSVDATNGIGLGTGKVNAALCTPSTIVTGLTYSTYLFADPVHLTPAAHALFASYASTRLRARW